MAAPPDKYQRMLDAHLEVNPKSWAALQARGIDEATPLSLDFEFTAEGEQEVRALMRHLRTTTDYETHGGARNEPDGSQRWLVLGTTSPLPLSLDALDEWVTRMTASGRDHGPAAFDGWGARIPESRQETLERARGGFSKLPHRRRR